jgi:NAD(P)-dependent dehydrogenase (short-subunit alcohol dehydrogenase family)
VSATYLIVGGSSGLGRALAERFAAGGYALALVSSDARDTEALAADLRLRHRVEVAAVACDLAHREVDLGAIDRALERLPPLEGVMIPAGMNRDDDRPARRSISSRRFSPRISTRRAASWITTWTGCARARMP